MGYRRMPEIFGDVIHEAKETRHDIWSHTTTLLSYFKEAAEACFCTVLEFTASVVCSIIGLEKGSHSNTNNDTATWTNNFICTKEADYRSKESKRVKMELIQDRASKLADLIFNNGASIASKSSGDSTKFHDEKDMSTGNADEMNSVEKSDEERPVLVEELAGGQVFEKPLECRRASMCC